MRFSQTEIQHLLIAWLGISIAFAIVEGGLTNLAGFVIAIIFSAITVGIGFLAHELAHKFLAQRYGAAAEFRADFMMLGLAIVMSFTGFLFAAPGAVMIFGRITREQYGKISAAGPITNFAVAIIFGALAILSGGILGGMLKSLFMYGFMINSWLGAFNLIPFGNFDGIKILRWNKVVYGILVAVGIALVAVSGYAGKI